MGTKTGTPFMSSLNVKEQSYPFSLVKAKLQNRKCLYTYDWWILSMTKGLFTHKHKSLSIPPSPFLLFFFFNHLALGRQDLSSDRTLNWLDRAAKFSMESRFFLVECWLILVWWGRLRPKSLHFLGSYGFWPSRGWSC